MSGVAHSRRGSTILRGIGTATLFAATLSTFSVPVHADRTAADYFAQRGDKAVRDRKWAEAQENFRRALEEEEHHVPARVGLGEAQFAAGERAGALESWRRVSSDAEAVKPLPAAWADAIARGRKRLADADAATAALAKIVDKQVEDLVALAERWADKDPDVTARALRSAVLLRPEHAKAAAMFERLGSPAGDWTPLFDGRTLEGWTGPPGGPWTVAEGQLVADVKKGTYRLIHDRVLKGDFDIRVEAKYIEQYEGQPGFEIGGAMKWGIQGTLLGIVGSELNLQEHEGREKTAMRFSFSSPLADLANPFDPSEWTIYELRFRGTQISVVINGKEVVTRERAETRDEGQVCLVVQNQKIVFRRVEAMQR